MSNPFRTALTAVALCAIPSVAAAKPHRLVILNFDGPDPEAARSTIMTMLSDNYDLVPARRWREARAVVAGVDGAAGWLAAAVRTRVDAVITGWVQPENDGPNSLTVQVMEAASGLVIDTLSVRMTADDDLSEETSEALHAKLEDVFCTVNNWDSVATRDDEGAPEADTPTEMEVDPGSIFPTDRVQFTFEISGLTLEYGEPASQPEGSELEPDIEISW